MNSNLLGIVQRIIAGNGEAVLDDAKRLKAFFSDLAKDEPKPLRIAFGRCIESGAYNALKTAPDAAERASRKAAIAQRLRDEHGLDAALCGEALDVLEAALFGETKLPPLCTRCGKALQENWAVCPYCGTAYEAAKETPRSAPLQSPPAAASATSTVVAKPPEPMQRDHTVWTVLIAIASSCSNACFRRQRTLRNVLIAAVAEVAVIAAIGGVMAAAYQPEQQRLAKAARAEVNRVEEEKAAAEDEIIRAAAPQIEAAWAKAQRMVAARTNDQQAVRRSRQLAAEFCRLMPYEIREMINSFLIADALKLHIDYKGSSMTEMLINRRQFQRAQHPKLWGVNTWTEHLGKALVLGNMDADIGKIQILSLAGMATDKQRARLVELRAKRDQLLLKYPPYHKFWEIAGQTVQSLSLMKEGMAIGVLAGLIHPILGMSAGVMYNAGIYAGLAYGERHIVSASQDRTIKIWDAGD
jgi:hypothetical protein